MKIHIPEMKSFDKDESIVKVQPAFDIETDNYELLPNTTYIIHSDHTVSPRTENFGLNEGAGSFRTDKFGKVIVFIPKGETFTWDHEKIELTTPKGINVVSRLTTHRRPNNHE